MIRAHLYQESPDTWCYDVVYKGVTYFTDNTGSMQALVEPARRDVAVLARLLSAGYELPKPPKYIPQRWGHTWKGDNKDEPLFLPLA